MKQKCPCFGCEDRHITCHVYCKGYKDWKRAHDEIEAAKQTETQTRPDYRRYGWKQMKRLHERMRGR